MSETLKALVLVFAVSTVTLFFFRKPLAASFGRKHADIWSLTWLVMTSLVFLVTNYWIFLIVAVGAIFILSRGEPVKPAIYLLLLCIVAKLGESIPGFAGINKFIEVTPQLIASFVLLVPAMLVGRHMKKLNKTGGAADLYFLLFLLVQIGLTVRAPSFTHMLRTAIQEFLAIAPIYYVFSRYPKSFEDMRVLSAAFVLPIIVLSAITIPEFVRGWHFYYPVSSNWFGPMPFGYTMREGYLRASASVFNPIVWGYVAMCGMGIGLATLNDKIPRFHRWAGFGLLVAGLIVSLSRGPWIGAMAIIGFYILLGPKMVARAIQAGVIAIVAGAASLMTPLGKNVIGLMPVIGGDSADDTIDYRRALLDQAWEVMLQNPFFGSPNIAESTALESLRQGQGIIDIVNTYLQIGLKSGLIGLGLFAAFFATVLLALRKAMKSAQKYDPLFANYCRAYLATLIGVLLTIFTTSAEGQIADIFWIFGALGIALARIEHEMRPAVKKNEDWETV